MLEIVLQVLYIIFQIYLGMMIISIFSSWVPAIRDNAFFGGICNLGDEYLSIFRGKLILGIFDFGTIIGLIIYETVINMLLRVI